MNIIKINFTKNNNENNNIFNYIKENINVAPLVFFKKKEFDYALEIVKFLYPNKINDIVVNYLEYVRISIENFPYLTKNNYKKKSYVNFDNNKYFLQINNPKSILTENYFTITIK
jgi:hypothetical protein